MYDHHKLMVLDQYCQLLHSEWSPLYHPELTAAYITALFSLFSSFLFLPPSLFLCSPPPSSSDSSSVSHTSYLTLPGLFSLPLSYSLSLSSTQWFLLGANISNFATGGIWGVLFHLGLAGEGEEE